MIRRIIAERRINAALVAFTKSDLARAWRMENDAEYRTNPYAYVSF
jgi:hypothetical protein